jgi:hypothetical protein
LLVERVVDNLQGFPIALSLQDFVHLLLSSTVAFTHDPSVELSKPYLLQENLDITRREIVDLLRDFLDSNTLIARTFVSERNNGVDEFSEVVTDWESNKNILEKTDKVLTGKATDTLKTLEFT